LRIERLRALVSALSVSDMEPGAMSDLLMCSTSAIRNYIHELTTAMVIIAPACESKAGIPRNKRYRLSTDLQQVQRFLAGLDGAEASGAQARRDPLVEALFGTAGKKSEIVI
jgi:hypothetical protein